MHGGMCEAAWSAAVVGRAADVLQAGCGLQGSGRAAGSPIGRLNPAAPPTESIQLAHKVRGRSSCLHSISCLATHHQLNRYSTASAHAAHLRHEEMVASLLESVHNLHNKVGLWGGRAESMQGLLKGPQPSCQQLASVGRTSLQTDCGLCPRCLAAALPCPEPQLNSNPPKPPKALPSAPAAGRAAAPQKPPPPAPADRGTAVCLAQRTPWQLDVPLLPAAANKANAPQRTQKNACNRYTIPTAAAPTLTTLAASTPQPPNRPSVSSANSRAAVAAASESCSGSEVRYSLRAAAGTAPARCVCLSTPGQNTNLQRVTAARGQRQHPPAPRACRQSRATSFGTAALIE